MKTTVDQLKKCAKCDWAPLEDRGIGPPSISRGAQAGPDTDIKKKRQSVQSVLRPLYAGEFAR